MGAVCWIMGAVFCTMGVDRIGGVYTTGPDTYLTTVDYEGSKDCLVVVTVY